MVESSTTRVIEMLIERGLTIAVAESLTGGMLTGELVSVPGASATVFGGVVAYNTELKRTILGVDAALLASHGPVHPAVAAEMAAKVRTVLAVGGCPADVGLATTGVAGPDSADEHPVGTVFLGMSVGESTMVSELHLSGDREAIRQAAVAESISRLLEYLTRMAPGETVGE